MFSRLVFLTALAVLAPGLLAAEQTTSDKATEAAKDTRRAAKKGAHRVQEALCAEGDTVCLAKKVKHRAEEGVETVKDKAN